MKKLLTAMLVALLMVGCGGEGQNPEDSNDTEKNASALTPPVVQPVKAPFVDKWAEWEANPKPYGGLEVLAKIKEAKESNTTSLDLRHNKISDLSPLDGLTNLEVLKLYDNKISDLSPLKGLTKLEKLYLRFNPISDAQKAMLKKALPNCGISFSPSTASVQVAPASESINSSSGE